MKCYVLVVLGLLFASRMPLHAQAVGAGPRSLDVKYVRDSEEYSALARQTYRLAADAVSRAATGAAPAWAVVLDIDETTLDNSAYQLERAAYDLAYDDPSWNAWVERRESPPVPGVVSFIRRVRELGGHVAWISNRAATVTGATQANLQADGLWSPDDRLCTQKDAKHTKADRRREVLTGQGDCAWAGTPMRVLAFVGDQMGDFPEPSEGAAQPAGDEAFGRSFFLLPNPMYGAWTTRVTRRPQL